METNFAPSFFPLSLLFSLITSSYWNALTGLNNYSLYICRYSSSSVQFSHSVVCDPMDCSTPGFPVYHQLPERAQTHVYWVSDATQPSHPLPSASPTTFNLSQHQSLFQWVNSSHEVAKVGASASPSASVLPMNIQDWFPLGWTGWIFLQS